MKYKYLLASLLIIAIFLSINNVVAEGVDLNNMSDTLNSENPLECIEIESSQSFNNVITDENEEFDVGSSDDGDILSEGYEVDVRVTDGIIGDFDEDPILLAVDSINGAEVESATLNIHNGTYVLWPSYFIQFYNINELCVNGVDGEVIFEPLIEEGASANGAFGFSNSANIIFNNITFDLSKITSSRFNPAEMTEGSGSALNVTLNDCTFISNSHLLDTRYANTNYINCRFINFTGDYFFNSLATNTYTYFENCIFSNLNITRISSNIDKNNVIVTFDGVWLGQNELPTYTVQSVNEYASGTYDIFTYGPKNNLDTPYTIPVKYAIFSVSENLCDNYYEIVGRLTWNGTNSSEGMENFPPLTVALSSTTGEIPSTVTLVNGAFKVNYTSSASEHKVTAKLDSEEINLTFVSKAKDYTFNISEITNVKVGDTKELIITLPDDADGQVVISIGDTNFTETVNGNTTKVNITGFVLGENIINITYSGNDRYESKTKNITVSAVKETTLTTTNVTTTYNVAKDLVITLVANGDVLVNKTVNVVVGTINKNLTTNASGQVSIDVSTLAPNSYVANIAFEGDDLYLKSSTAANVLVNKIVSSLSAPDITATYNVAKNLVITLTANGKALTNQKITVKVGTISKTLTTNDKGQVSVDVSKLTPKTYAATFIYEGDSINAKSTNTAKVVINKATPKITAKKATFKAKTKTKKYSIVLKDNKGKAIKKAKVTLKVKGKTYKATTNAKGKATFKITKLTKKGKNTATIKFGGNNYFKSISKKVNIVVKK
jgi:hypothetical protein